MRAEGRRGKAGRGRVLAWRRRPVHPHVRPAASFSWWASPAGRISTAASERCMTSDPTGPCMSACPQTWRWPQRVLGALEGGAGNLSSGAIRWYPSGEAMIFRVLWSSDLKHGKGTMSAAWSEWSDAVKSYQRSMLRHMQGRVRGHLHAELDTLAKTSGPLSILLGLSLHGSRCLGQRWAPGLPGPSQPQRVLASQEVAGSRAATHCSMRVLLFRPQSSF